MNPGSRNGSNTAIAVVVTVNVEVESHDEMVAGGAGLFGRYSYGRYGAREGVWRLLNTFRDEAIHATFFIDAEDAVRHPAMVEAILLGGHEVAQLGPRDIEDVSDAERLKARLRESRDALSEIAGQPILGWRAATGVMTAQTLPLLAELGFLYDSSFHDDDQPYLFQDGQGASIVELPVFKYLTDTTFYTVRRTDESVRKVWNEEFDAMHQADSYMLLTVSSRGDFGSGRAQRARIVGDWVRRAARTPGMMIMRGDQLARRTKESSLPGEPFPYLEEFAGDIEFLSQME